MDAEEEILDGKIILEDIVNMLVGLVKSNLSVKKITGGIMKLRIDYDYEL